MKRVLLFLGLFLGGIHLNAQQSELYSQYMHNPFILNPAVAGTYNFFQIRLLSRLQWAGFTDAPVTNSLSVFGPVSAKNKDMGYGVTVFSDITSPTSRTGIRGAYAYNRAINDFIRASLGLVLGIRQYKYDGSKVTAYSNTDPLNITGVHSFYIPDAMIGALVYSNMFQVGFSTDNLFNNKLQFNPETQALSKLKSHFYLYGSYKYAHSRKWESEYSTLLKYVSPSPLQFDLNAKIIYMKTSWAGLSFRSFESVSLLAGHIFNKRIYAGYSFDYNISPIRRYSFGSHEIMIGYRFNSLK